jgi:hypothetical protein
MIALTRAQALSHVHFILISSFFFSTTLYMFTLADFNIAISGGPDLSTKGRL